MGTHNTDPRSRRSKPHQTGSLTLTLRRGDEIVIHVPDGEPIVVYCADAQHGRCSLNVKAPRSYQIDRKARGEGS